jgi:hypothetical protein
MFQLVHFVWTWLATANALAPYSVVTLAAFGLIYAWRKLSPKSWLWIESRLPFAAELDAGETLAKNLVLSLPSLAIGAALAALGGGVSFPVALLGALAGAAAPLLHHVRKALPFDPYRGAVADVLPADASDKLPKPPRLPNFLPILIAGIFAGCGAVSGESLLPCDAHDRAAQVDLAANAARSKLEREACKDDQACIDAAIAKADKYVDERCALPGAK